MGSEKAKRIQTSLLNAAEKKLLISIAKRMPREISSDMLTCVGVIGAVLTALGFILSNYSPYWLWLAVVGLIVNWYGDSLDGSVARVRHTQRPVYGFFLDHSVDVINELFFFVGAGLSPFINLPTALFALSGYLALTVYTNILTIVKDEFRLTYLGLGPTEFRLLACLLCIVFMYVPEISTHTWEFTILHETYIFGWFDFFALAASVILWFCYVLSFFRDAKRIGEQDPLPEVPETDETH